MPRLHFKLQLLCFAFALLLVPSIALAQTDSGRISGSARDENGAIIPGAEISVTNDRTGEERNAIWERQKKLAPGFADYEKRTTRRIPVVVLERVS